MRKIINNKLYDTDTAKEMACFSYDNYGSFSHFSETLYRKKTGEYFLFGEGGAASRYSKKTGQNEWSGDARIIPISFDRARAWAEENLDADEYEAIFGEISEDDGKEQMCVTLSAKAAETIRRKASITGRTVSELIDELILG